MFIEIRDPNGATQLINTKAIVRVFHHGGDVVSIETAGQTHLHVEAGLSGAQLLEKMKGQLAAAEGNVPLTACLSQGEERYEELTELMARVVDGHAALLRRVEELERQAAERSPSPRPSPPGEGEGGLRIEDRNHEISEPREKERVPTEPPGKMPGSTAGKMPASTVRPGKRGGAA